MGGPSKSATPGRQRKKSTESGVAASDRAPRVDRSKRLLDLVMLLLRARSPVTFREIREQFTSYQTRNIEAGLRAFERDKADLLELGVPIRYVTPDEDDAVEDGGYVIDLHRFRLPEVRLNSEEVSALVLAAAMARAVPGVSYARIVDLALKKLAFDVPEPPDTPVEFAPLSDDSPPVLVHFPAMDGARSKALGDRFTRLEAATRFRKRVTIHYRSASSGYTTKRDVNPYGLVYREGSWVLVGYCHMRDEIRSFRLDRMLEVTVAPKPKSPDFERPEDFDVRAYANRSPWTFQTENSETVELAINEECSHMAREDFGRDALVSHEPSGAARVRFRCGNPEFAVARILAAKGGIVPAEGSRLKTRLAAELTAIKELYQ